MMLSAASLVTVLVALTSSASATVFTGTRTATDGSKSNVAWTNGTPDICSGYGTIQQGTGNPCGINFWVDGGNGPFTLSGCGGNGLTLFRNGQFNSNCKSEKRTINCSGGVKIAQNWACY
ncbi:uncharacterized protein CTRU02_204734 [Colletotrichum truncatum]|uniref:Uncharacterized protein n=1 Tax=Colletotrichum truncatum TaxID=5467 RepID=A0ACC3ZCZ4_COLTU|nr:uncharacterized protein CTRU02_02969 [Colletotrichum truncatum]KAF6797927.1 hypothetical protein CTRU02_02969 [Colletotrichum truncatum]